MIVEWMQGHDLKTYLGVVVPIILAIGLFLFWLTYRMVLASSDAAKVMSRWLLWGVLGAILTAAFFFLDVVVFA